MDEEEIKKLRVVDIQKELGKRGLPRKGLKAVLVARLVDAINKEKENQSDSESSDDENRDPNTPKKEKVKKEIPQNKEDENSGEQSSEEENSEDGSSEDESSEEELSEKETETVEEIPASPAGSIADNLPTRSTPNGHPNEYPPEEFGHSTAEERAVKVWEEHSAAWMATVQEVAAQVHPDLPLTTGAAHLLRSYALHVLMHLKSHTEAHAPKHPLMATDLQRAVAAKYPADLAAHATEEIHRAVRLARESLNATQDVGGPVEGLVVEPAAVAKLWRTLGGATLSVGAAAAVAAVVEYLWAEVVELGGHAAHRYGHVALTALTLRQGVNADSELSGLLWMTPVTSSSWRVAAAHLWQALATETAEECAAAQFSLSAALATLTAQRSVAESLQTLPATDDVIALRSQLRLERVSTHGRQWTVGGVRWQWKEKSDPVQPAESILSDPELETSQQELVADGVTVLRVTASGGHVTSEWPAAVRRVSDAVGVTVSKVTLLRVTAVVVSALPGCPAAVAPELLWPLDDSWLNQVDCHSLE